MAISEKLITRLLTTQEGKQIFTEILLNNTDKISKISDESVVNALSYGVAKLFQRGIKDIAVIESKNYPDTATGTDLDDVASLFGVSDRLGAAGSSTFIQVKASVGTVYVQGVNKFTSRSGLEFEIIGNHTIDSNGFAYIPIRSTETGVKTNVEAGTITNVVPKPVGHFAATNEYMAIGGRDAESDESLRIRIRTRPNIQAQQTIPYVTEIIRDFNANVLRVFGLGVDDTTNKSRLGLVLENGIELTDSELSELEQNITPYISFIEGFQIGNTLGVQLENISWFYVGGGVGIDFRVDILSNYDTEDVRKNMQISLTKYLDFRYWVRGTKVEWDDLLDIIKSTDGVRYVPDEYFLPNGDGIVPYNSLPRIQDFKMRDLDGVLIFDNSSTDLSVFYTT